MNAKDCYETLEFVPREANYFAEARISDIFAEKGPVELDLGCGDGGFLLEMAARFPERRFLGVERLLGRVRKVCRKAERRGLGNVCVLRLDSAYAVRWLLPKCAFARIHLLFPDPWPKKKHHKRRLVTADFAEAICDLLEPGGEFLFRTDHPEYFEEAAAAILGCERFEALDWPDDAFFYAMTDFERIWRSEGKEIQKLRVRGLTGTPKTAKSP